MVKSQFLGISRKMEKIDILMERADSENGFSKQTTRRYSFQVSCKNCHELSIMFECLHKEDLHPSKLTMIDNHILKMNLVFLFDDKDKVKNFAQKMLSSEIKIWA